MVDLLDYYHLRFLQTFVCHASCSLSLQEHSHIALYGYSCLKALAAYIFSLLILEIFFICAYLLSLILVKNTG